MRGFFVKVIDNGEEKNLKITTPFLTAGNDYKSSILAKSLNKQIVIAENREKCLKVNLTEFFEFKVHHNNKVFSIEEIKGIFPNQRFIELNKDVICEFAIDNKKIFFKAVDIKEEKKVTTNNFKKSYISKENLSFSTLFLILSFIMLSFFIYASVNVKPVEKVAKLEENQKELEIEYKKIETESTEKKADKRKIKADDKISIEGKQIAKKADTVKDTGIKSGGTFFEGQAVLKEGVLGVREGAKTVVIQKEKSLFSKIDETLENIPVKGSGEVSERARKIDGGDLDKFESVKAESIYKGPEKKEVKAELSSGASIKAMIQKEQDIRIIKGKRPENEILSIMARYKKGFEFIFIDSRKKDPQIEGKVVVFFVISEDGTVTKAEVVESTIKNQEFIERILGLIRSIKFPKSDSGDTGVKIPFLFFPQG